MAVTYCPKCGKETSETEKFCSNCGSAFEQGNEASIKKPKKKKKRTIIIVAVLIFVLLVGIIGSSSEDEKIPADDNSKASVSEVATTSKDDFISSCKTIDYKTIARHPDDYKGENVVFKGEVIQAMQSGQNFTLRVCVSYDKTLDMYDYEDVVYVEYKLPKDAPRILENDIITFYGTCKGSETYYSAIGGQITIPSVDAAYVEIHE